MTKKLSLLGVGGLVVALCGGLLYAITRPYHIPESPQAVYDTDDRPLTHSREGGRGPQESPPSEIIDLLRAVEDQRIGNHSGVDVFALAQATKERLMGSKMRGASTITQQLIKHHLHHHKRSLKNKLTEMRYALRLTSTLDTHDIIRQYLNYSPFVYEVRGRRAACDFFREMPCEHLSTPQIRVLLSMTQRSLNPYTETDQDRIIERIHMYQRKRSDVFDPSVRVDRSIFDALARTDTRDPRVSELLTLTNRPGSAVYSQSLAHTIDTILSQTASLREQYLVGACCVLVMGSDGQLLSANICTDHKDPEAGYINACLKKRQTGSTIKPFVYLLSFYYLGRTPVSIIRDEPTEYTLADGSIYAPKNFDLQYHGDVTIAYALGNSLNIPAVKTLHDIGIERFYHSLQLREEKYGSRQTPSPQSPDELGLSMALGTYEMTPLMMTQLWQVFGDTESVFSVSAQEIRQILSDYQNKIISFGQDSFLDRPGRAIKTGTSRHFVDGWICGIQDADDTIVCLWLGNYDNTPMQGSSSEVGSYIRSEIAERVEEREAR